MEIAIETIQILAMAIFCIFGILLILIATREKEYRFLWAGIPIVLLYIAWWVLSILVD